MKKRKQSYNLQKIQELLHDEALSYVTAISRKNAVALGYMTRDDMIAVVDGLSYLNFYKSMPSEYNQNLWQDVYKTSDGQKKIYIKVQLIHGGTQAVLVQFKKDEGGD
jgi:hypothetical protein